MMTTFVILYYYLKRCMEVLLFAWYFSQIHSLSKIEVKLHGVPHFPQWYHRVLGRWQLQPASGQERWWNPRVISLDEEEPLHEVTSCYAKIQVIKHRTTTPEEMSQTHNVAVLITTFREVSFGHVEEIMCDAVDLHFNELFQTFCSYIHTHT